MELLVFISKSAQIFINMQNVSKSERSKQRGQAFQPDFKLISYSVLDTQRAIHYRNRTDVVHTFHFDDC